MKTNEMFSSKNREVLKRLLEKRGVAAKQIGIPPWDGDRARAPLSFAQHRLWLSDQMNPGNFGYNMPSAYRLRGVFSIPVLERSLNEVLRRHESLRTSFQVVDGGPVQVVAPDATFVLPYVDLTTIPETERENRALRMVVEESQSPFNLTTDRLLRGKLLRIRPDDHILLLTMHHIVSDGWSTRLLGQEVITLYAAFSQGQPSPLPELPIQYIDFAAWQKESLQGERLQTLQDYWRKHLADMPVLELPSDHPRPEVTSYRGDTRSIQFSPAQTDAIRAFCQAKGLSTFTVLLSGFLILLARHTGQLDITVRSPVANRTRQQTETLIGYFVNILALRINLSGNPTFQALANQVSKVCQGAYAHQDLPFEQALDDVRPVRRGRGPLFPVMFTSQKFDLSMPDIPDVVFSPLVMDNEMALFDLTVNIWENDPAFQVDFNYNSDLFDLATIEAMLQDFRAILESAISNSEQPLDALEKLIPEAHIPVVRPQSLNEWLESGQQVLPGTENEKTLAEIWQNAFGIARVGIHDNFFKLGGDSLLALRVVSQAGQSGLRLTPHDFFQYQTIAELAAKAVSETDSATVDTTNDEMTGPLPLTPSQAWFLGEAFPDSNWWNVSHAFKVSRAQIKPDLLEQAVWYILRYHEALRARFVCDESGWTQIIAASDEFSSPFRYIDLSALPKDTRDQAADRTKTEVQQSMDVSVGPLLRVALIDTGTMRLQLLISSHHLVIDELSFHIMLDDLLTVYQQLCNGAPVQLSARSTSFQTWAKRVYAYAQSAEFTQRMERWLALPWSQTSPLPVDYPDGKAKNTMGSIKMVWSSLSVDETTALLKDIPKVYGVQVVDALLTALVESIARWAGRRWVVVNMVKSGRTERIPGTEYMDLTRTVGWVAMGEILLLEHRETSHPGEALESIKEQLQDVRGEGPLIYLAKLSKQYGDKGRFPDHVEELSFNYIGKSDQPSLGMGGIQSAPIFAGQSRNDDCRTNITLGCTGSISGNRLVWYWHYSENVHERATAEKLAANFMASLRTLIAHCHTLSMQNPTSDSEQ